MQNVKITVLGMDDCFSDSPIDDASQICAGNIGWIFCILQLIAYLFNDTKVILMAIRIPAKVNMNYLQ